MSKLVLAATLAISLLAPVASAQKGFGTSPGFGATTGAVVDPIDVLIGGEDGISDVGDPNTAPQVCARSNASCFYLSTTTGWWTATTSDGSSATDWSSINEELLITFQIEGDATYNTAGFSATDCLFMRAMEATVLIVCTDENSITQFSQDVLITRWGWIGRSNVGGANSQSGKDGCTSKMVTGADGTTDIANTEMEIPATDVVIVHGEFVSTTVGTTVSAGDNIMFKVKDGANCGDGSACVCDGNWGYSQIEVWGIKL